MNKNRQEKNGIFKRRFLSDEKIVSSKIIEKIYEKQTFPPHRSNRRK